MDGERLRYIPPVVFLKISDSSSKSKSKAYTIVHNNDHTNVLFLFNESQRRNYEGDYLSIFEGFYGSYPNLFIELDKSEIAQFNKMVEKMKTEDDWQAIEEKYAIRRTHKKKKPNHFIY